MTQDHGDGHAPAADGHGGNGHTPAGDTGTPGGVAPNIDTLVNQLSPKFQQYIDSLHPEKLADKNKDIKTKLNSAYNSFMDYMKTNNLPTYIKTDSTNKAETARKTLDSFLLHLIKQFDPAFTNHLSGEHFEDDTTRSSYIRAFAQNLFGITNEIFQQAQGRMAQGGDLLEGLELVANYMRDKDRGYLSHLNDMEFTNTVGNSLYHKAAFARYLRTKVPAFGEYFKDYSGSGEGLEGKLAINDQLRERVVQAVVHSAYEGDGGKDYLAASIGYKKAGGQAPAHESAPAGHH